MTVQLYTYVNARRLPRKFKKKLRRKMEAIRRRWGLPTPSRVPHGTR